jgi:hypothetical protein
VEIKGDTVRLSSGTEFYANMGILGLGGGYLFEGYDGDTPDDKFTPSERQEIADYMCQKYQEWAKNPVPWT